MKIVKVILIDTLTNEVKEIIDSEYPNDYDDDAIEYMWTDGNFGCDCNRSHMVYLDNDKTINCNVYENRFKLLNLFINNKEWDLMEHKYK